VSLSTRSGCDGVFSRFKDYKIVVIIILYDVNSTLELITIDIVTFYILLLLIGPLATILQSSIILLGVQNIIYIRICSARIILTNATNDA